MTNTDREKAILELEALPGELRRLLAGATDEQLAQPYRAGGWNARQVVHHLADSHMNAYIRSHLILTEENPTLKPYDQEVWAALPFSSNGPLEPSLTLLTGLHTRWGAFFRSLPENAWARPGMHPEYGPVTLEGILTSYAEHGRNHLEHIRVGLGT